jgi:hypothetical protein
LKSEFEDYKFSHRISCTHTTVYGEYVSSEHVYGFVIEYDGNDLTVKSWRHQLYPYYEYPVANIIDVTVRDVYLEEPPKPFDPESIKEMKSIDDVKRLIREALDWIREFTDIAESELEPILE